MSDPRGRDDESCPACGGSGGGPFGPAGSAWDDEAYVCPACGGEGIRYDEPPSRGPGLVKAEPALRPDEIRRKAPA